MYKLHAWLEQEPEFADPEEYLRNRYLLEKIKEAEEDTDTMLRSHDEVWQGVVHGKQDYQDKL